MRSPVAFHAVLLSRLTLINPAASEGRANLLFTVVDDLGSRDLGFQSHQLLTPHIDSLAAEAVVLKNYYTLPVCSPTRTSILSGLYPMRYGLQHQVIWSGAPAGLPTNVSTIADYLSRGGYACHAIGGSHLPAIPQNLHLAVVLKCCRLSATDRQMASGERNESLA